MVYRVFFYLLGLTTLALGIILNSIVGLGVSPIISVAFTAHELWGMSFPNTTFFMYCFLVLLEIIIHLCRKKGWMRILLDLCQIPLSIVFTRVMNFYLQFIPDISDGELWLRYLVLIFAIIFTGIGAALSVDVKLIPNPGDGIVWAVSEVINKSVGFTKNCVDTTCILTTICLGLIVDHHLHGVGVGTVIAVIMVGRVMAVFNHYFLKKLQKLWGIDDEK